MADGDGAPFTIKRVEALQPAAQKIGEDMLSRLTERIKTGELSRQEAAQMGVRAGDGLIMANDIGNRDPDAFPDPDRLDIRRDARHHVAFGFGVHQCLGQPLARLELQIVYSTLYRRIPTLRLAADLEQIPFKHDGSVYGVYELPVTW